MVTLKEGLLVCNGNRFGLDVLMPLRLQKRQLLESLGFPGNDKLVPCMATEEERVKALFREYAGLGFPFLVLVSERPSRTIIPPLFIVRGDNDIVWRDDGNTKRCITYSDAMQVIKGYDSSTWLEFSSYIWGPETMAGRLLYISPDVQIIELQMGVIPNQLLVLDNTGLPAYSGQLSFFELEHGEYRSASAQLMEAGCRQILPCSVVRRVAEYLGRCHFRGFLELAKVASFPTLEFGIPKGHSLISIDIDWPSQWEEV